MIQPMNSEGAAVQALRAQQSMFDNTWVLALVLTTALVVLCWYFRLAQLNIAPIIWTLAAIALLQMALGSLARHASSRARVRWLVLASQLLGTALLGGAWHLFGGLQQPLFPLFILLPLLPAALLLGFWQQQLAVLGLLMVLASGVLLSPDTNSFIAEHYGLGIGIAAVHWLPAWIPHSRNVFPDMYTSPPYRLMVTITLAVLALSLGTAARALVGLFQGDADRVTSMERELLRLQSLGQELISRASSAEVLLVSATGRIVNASERFLDDFKVTDVSSRFLLDAVAFAYPAVVRRLITSGGQDIQGALVEGREITLRLRAELFGAGGTQLTRLSLVSCDELCWRGEVDALEEPVFVVDSRGQLAFLNHSALNEFGAQAEGSTAIALFDAAAGRWWDIAPLETARRIVQRGSRQYVVAIRRRRIAASVGEMAFVHLSERDRAPAAG